MRLKRRQDVQCRELPRVESPVFARSWVKNAITAEGLRGIEGLEDVLTDDLAPYHRIWDHHAQGRLLEKIEGAEIFLIHGLGHEPRVPAVRMGPGIDDGWKPDEALNAVAHFHVQWMLDYALQTCGIWAPVVGDTPPVKEPPKKEEPEKDPATLQFVYPEKDEHKQYVNLDENGKEEGMYLRLRVKVENPVEGQTVYWKVTADSNNSKRTEPEIGIKRNIGASLNELRGGVATCTSKVKGEEAEAVLVCGVAGGDKFTIEAGTEDGNWQDKVTVVNWRKLWYEIMCPDFTALTTGTDADGNAILDYPSQMKTRLTDRAASVFVEFWPHSTHTFTEAEAPSNSVFRSEQLGLPAGSKGYVLTDHTFRSYPKTFNKGKSPRSVNIKLCDKNYYFDSVTPLTTDTYNCFFDRYTVKVTDWYWGYFLPESAMDGAPSIKSLTWRALIDPSLNPGHPAVKNGIARSGTLSASDIDFRSVREFDICLPVALPDDPGNLASYSVTATTCPIEVKIAFEVASEGLGLSGQGAQKGELLSFYNHQAKESSIDVLLHEIGHGVGLTVYKGLNKPPPGLDYPKTADGFLYFFQRGNAYVGRGHSGSHCANGLSGLQKFKSSFGGLPGTCIMFGENDSKDPSLATAGFCDECKMYFSARELDDLNKNWRI